MAKFKEIKMDSGNEGDKENEKTLIAAFPCAVFFHQNKSISVLVGILGCLLFAVAGIRGAYAAPLSGVGFSFSRVVLMADKRGGATVDVNNNTPNVYLMQSRVVNADPATGMPVEPGNNTAPFLVLPPLQRVDAQQRLSLRIIASPDGTAKLPQDRESVFFLATKAIPSVPSKGDKGHMAIALVNNIKLFWRPKGLKSEVIDDVSNTLTISRDGNKLKVTNHSAYYLTFFSLTVGGQAVSPEALRAMVPPRGSWDYPLPKGITGGTASWKLIDEYGLPTKEQQSVVR
ncbi:TPA: molecular chaperone [Serratia marcescens]|uniref:Molecular chaperone n=2 Tax=Serratia TaxID=613 RepID=A0A9X8VLL3_SERMA|nr:MULTISPECIES: molecular chaperone [Serratia]MBS3894524.1 molecular chaperone [Serratia marcescens]TXE22536.1 molecular chaperone [Serratia ureilytica]HBC7422434.1 molecular chaperone [Serratia marcescens]